MKIPVHRITLILTLSASDGGIIATWRSALACCSTAAGSGTLCRLTCALFNTSGTETLVCGEVGSGTGRRTRPKSLVNLADLVVLGFVGVTTCRNLYSDISHLQVSGS